jgi:putative transposase
MKPVCEALKIARSNVARLHMRPADWQDGRLHRTDGDRAAADADLAHQLGTKVKDLASYGYRRACALVNRDRRAQALPRLNHKRAYRVMAEHQLLLPTRPAGPARRHDGRIAVDVSDQRWCSDGFEIKCDNGQTVTAVFAKDCCDRQIISWRAWGCRGLPAAPVCDMLIEAVSLRFGNDGIGDRAPQPLQFLSDNGSAYIASQTRALMAQLGIQPINTPVGSPQSNGMAESFVNSFRLDYEPTLDKSSPTAVLAQLPDCFEHYNHFRPHSALKMMSPNEFRAITAVTPSIEQNIQSCVPTKPIRQASALAIINS